MSILRLLIVAAAVFLTIGSFAAEPKELRDAKQAFQKQSPHPTEADRARYVSKLVHLRQKLAAADKDGWQAVDAEIMAHPAPANSAGRPPGRGLGQFIGPAGEVAQFLCRSNAAPASNCSKAIVLISGPTGINACAG